MAARGGVASTEALPGVSRIEPSIGFEVFERVLMEGPVQIAVLPFDLSTLLHLYPVSGGIAYFSEVFAADIQAIRSLGVSSQLDARPDLAQGYVAPRTDVEAAIAGIWQRALGIDRVGVCDQFFELGGDSVFAGQILLEVGRRFGVELSAEQAYREYTVEGLARMVEEALVREVEQLSDAAAAELLVGGASDGPGQAATDG
jgi:phthiocerol/phenolphthiocerol synthesis type-I polyketide synthase D/myxalamid-type polyketide synthase MxaE and MxaD